MNSPKTTADAASRTNYWGRSLLTSLFALSWLLVPVGAVAANAERSDSESVLAELAEAGLTEGLKADDLAEIVGLLGPDGRFPEIVEVDPQEGLVGAVGQSGSVLSPAMVCGPSVVEGLFTSSGFSSDDGSSTRIKAMAVYDDGSGPAVYVAGDFEYADGQLVNNIARWDGTHWRPVGLLANPGFNGTVNTLQVFDDGEGPRLYVGGYFSHAGSLQVNAVASWDGQAWERVGFGMNASVHTLAVLDHGNGPTLFAGGVFDLANHGTGWHGTYLGVVAQGGATWDGTLWSGLGTSFPTANEAVVVQEGPTQTLYLGYGTEILAWDGVSLVTLPMAVNSSDKALTVHDDGNGERLYVASSGSLHRWSGANWELIASMGTEFEQIDALVSWASPTGTVLLAAGNITEVEGVLVDKIARWDGTTWTAFGDLSGFEEIVGLAVDPQSSGGVYVGLGTTLYTEAEVRGWSGADWGVLGNGTGFDGDVVALEVHDDGSGPALYVGGDFTSYSGQPIERIFRWDGGSIQPLTGGGLNGSVRALAAFDDGGGENLYAAGYFTDAGGSGASYIAKWDSTGWSPLGTGTDLFAWVLEVHDDGSGPALFVGGNFTSAGGTPASKLARWDGTTWTGISLDTIGTVRAMASHGGDLYVAGDLSMVDGVPVNSIARWDGSGWSAVGDGLDSHVFALLSHAGNLYAGGSFTASGSTTVERVGYWNGLGWFQAGGGIGSAALDGVYSLGALDEGSGPILYAGGNFEESGSNSAPRLARAASFWWSGIGLGPNEPVDVMAPFDDGTGPGLFIGGRFDTVDGRPSGKLAKIQVPSECPEQGVPQIVLADPIDGFLTNQSQQTFGGSLSEEADLWLERGDGPSLDFELIDVALDLSFDHGPVALAEGLNVFSLWARDRDNQSSSVVVSLELDSKAPQVSIEAPQESSVVFDDQPALRIGYSDVGVGVDPTSLYLTVDGQPTAFLCQAGPSEANCLPEQALTPGVHTIRAIVEDLVANVSVEAVRTFTVDTSSGSQLTELQGLVQQSGAPAAGAVVSVLGRKTPSAVTASDGTFAIPNVPVVSNETFDVAAVLGSGDGALRGTAFGVEPIPGAVTSAGLIDLAPICEARFAAGSVGLGILGSSIRVSDSVVFDDGSGPALYIAGSFYSVAGVPAANIARWDGQRWTAVGDGTSGPVLSLAVYDDGSGSKLLAGGKFFAAGGSTAYLIAAWDGVAWSAVGNGIGGSEVSELVTYDGGSGTLLMAAGDFSSAGGVSVSNIASWDGSSWAHPGVNLDTVSALTVFDDGTGLALYSASAAIIGSQSGSEVHRFDGAVWSTVGEYGFRGQVNALLGFDDGSGPAIFAAGSFDYAGSWLGGFHSVAKWNGSDWVPAGGRLETWGFADGGRNGILDLYVFDDGTGAALYAGGNLELPEGMSVVRWNGSDWDLVGGGVETPWGRRAVASLMAYDSGDGAKLYAGGDLLWANGMFTGEIAHWDGTRWSPVGQGIVFPVVALEEFDDGFGNALFAGGFQLTAGGLEVDHIGRWNGEGWDSVGQGLNDSVFALEEFDDGNGAALYAGGPFTGGSGISANRIAGWNGTNWFPLGAGTNGSVREIHAHDFGSGGDLYVGGDFTTAGGLPANRVARWDGSAWSTLGTGANGRVWAMGSFDDGSGMALYMGGDFTTAGGTAATRIARWDGSAWSQVGGGANGTVRAFAVFDDGGGEALYVAGEFTSVGGTTANRIARWDGSGWSTIGQGFDGLVRQLAVADDGAGLGLYAVGDFTTADGLPAERLARWDGSSWSGPSPGLNLLTMGVAEFDDGAGPAIFVAGDFMTAGGDPSAHFAKWYRPLSCGPEEDVTPPTIAFDSPLDGALLSNPQFGFSVSHSDDGSGVDTSTLSLLIDGLPAVLGPCLTFGSTTSCSLGAPLSEGNHTLSATIEDFAGNASQPAQITVEIDSLPPSLVFTTPSEGDVVSVSSPDITLQYSDAGSGVDDATVDIQLVSGPTVSCVITSTETTCNPDPPVSEASYELTASVEDLAGNLAAAALSFSIDTVPPTLSILEPAAGSVTGDATPTIHLSLDDVGSGADHSTLGFEVDGVPIAATCNFAAGFASCVPENALADLGLPPVTLDLEASLSDFAGLVTTDSVQFTIDGSVPTETMAPVLSFTSPEPGEFLNPNVDPIVVIFGDNGSGAIPESLSIRVDGTEVAWVCDLCSTRAVCSPHSPIDGEVLTLTATITDNEGNVSSPANVTFTMVDTVPPEINAILQVAGPITNQSPVWLSGSVDDPSGVQTLTLDGEPLYFGYPNFGQFLDLVDLTEGLNTFLIEATDTLGNASQVELTVTYDPPPVIDLLAPLPNQITNQPEITFVGSLSEAATLTLDGSPVSLDGANQFDHGPIPLVLGSNSFLLEASDAFGSTTQLAVQVTYDPDADVTAPVITFTSFNPSPTTAPEATFTGFLSEPASLMVNTVSVAVDPANNFAYGPVLLKEGSNDFLFQATDGSGNIGIRSQTVVLDNQRPEPVDVLLVQVSEPVDGIVSVTGLADAVDVSEVGLEVWCRDLATSAIGVGGVLSDGSFALQLPAFYGDSLRLAVRDAAGTTSTEEILLVPGALPIPQDPSLTAPPLDRSVATSFFDQVEHLFSGASPVQYGVQVGALEPQRLVVLKGRVLAADGSPLPGVSVFAKKQVEVGRSVSRSDGYFDFVVNGGGRLTVSFSKTGYLPSERSLETSWHDYGLLDEIVLVPVDSIGSSVDFTQPSGLQVARGGVVTDSDGTRQATVLIGGGTSATAFFPDADSADLGAATLRATELSTGSLGLATLPATLPPAVGYSYAIELTLDETLASGASRVEFAPALPFYVENFLDMPIGTPVPAAFYDRHLEQWVPSSDGLVLEILEINGGLAELDIDGSGQAADAPALAQLGIADAERQSLGSLYAVGSTLWRVPIAHFSPWTFGWTVGATGPFSEHGPSVPGPSTSDDNKLDAPSIARFNSVVEVENQILGQSLSLAGTPLALNYRSDRVPGRRSSYELLVPLSGDTLPEGIKRIESEIQVGGVLVSQSFSALPNQSQVFEWDGEDSFGRPIQGAEPFVSRLGYVYDGLYQVPHGAGASFGLPSGQTLESNPSREEVTVWQRDTGTVGGLDGREAFGLGGWSLGIHHSFDPEARVLYYGSGGRRTLDSEPANLYRVAGLGSNGLSGDGGDARESELSNPGGVAVTSDGSLLIADTNNCRIRKVDPEGIISTIAGTDCDPPAGGSIGDGGLATDAKLLQPTKAIEGPDGDIYIADWGNNRVRKIDSEGIISTVAGTGDTGSGGSWGDGGEATNADIVPHDLAFGPEGDLYIADPDAAGSVSAHIHKVTAEGRLDTLNGEAVAGMFGGPVPTAAILSVRGLAFDSDGTLFAAANQQVSKVETDGEMEVITGWPYHLPVDYSGDGGPAADARWNFPWHLAVGRDRSLYVGDDNNQVVRRIGPDGIVNTIAGGGPIPPEDGTPATQAMLSFPSGVAVGPGGRNLYIAERGGHRVWRMATPAPGALPGVLEIQIPSENGSLLYFFSPEGRHLRTESALTSEILWTFDYTEYPHPEEGGGMVQRLTSVTDAFDNVTTIERDSEGVPTAVVGPFGQRTEILLQSEGYLGEVTWKAAPGGVDEKVFLTYKQSFSGEVVEGLLETLTDPKDQIYNYEYGPEGLLTRIDDPANGALILDRQETPSGHIVTQTTAEGRSAAFEVDLRNEGTLVQTRTGPNGLVTTYSRGDDAVLKTTFSDDTEVTLVEGPDPRFEDLAPRVQLSVTTTPIDGLERIVETGRTVNFFDPQNPIAVQSQIDTVTVNGRTATVEFSATEDKVTSTSPTGRESIVLLDSLGRPIESQVAQVEPVRVTYDEKGRLETVIQGPVSNERLWEYEYSPTTGYVEKVTDPELREVSYEYDEQGRVDKVILPDQREIEFTYDKNGNRTSVTPPSRPAHVFDHNEVNQVESYDPPDIGEPPAATVYDYNDDHQVTTVTRPDGQTVVFGYDTGGRLETLTLPNGVVTYTFDVDDGSVESISDPDGGSIAYTYDGPLVKTVSWGGEVAGSLELEYDDSFWLTSRKINADPNQEFEYLYDDDGFLTGIESDLFPSAGAGSGGLGDHRVYSDPDNGFLLGAELFDVGDRYTYDIFGGLESYRSGYDDGSCSSGGSPPFAGCQAILELDFTRDKLGRITQRTEMIGDPVAGTTETHTYDYEYDDAGRLTDVERDSVLVAHYDYDDNSNRDGWSNEWGSGIATYDDQDRLLTYDDLSFTYTTNGELLTKTQGTQTATYDYDVMGNLRQVVLEDGVTIDYVIDASNRRVGKKIDGVLVQGWIYKDGLNPTVELDGAGNVTTHYVYGTKGHVPDAMIRGGVAFRLISDNLGTVRAVVDVETGVVAQRIDYDVFGRVMLDTNPGFQPFGFAGGLTDRQTGLVRFGARDYDPVVGRWTSKDPIGFGGGSLGLYTYVANNPVNLVDPSGLWITPWEVLDALSYTISAREWSIAAERFGQDPSWRNGLDATGKLATAMLDGAALLLPVVPAVGGYLYRAGTLPTTLPDDALVCRGGTCSAERFREGSGVTLDNAGKLQDVSVNSASGKSVDELTTTIPNGQVGVTTVGDVRAAGGDVVPSPRDRNPDHCTLCGITPEQAEELFTPTIPNPNRRR